ncbi:MAG TPA: GDSL-type esterase/lipase family protein [Polyangia bacterium]|nr:GDSL-type esterase/lipase family protein [Polyangia bacterium]
MNRKLTSGIAALGALCFFASPAAAATSVACVGDSLTQLSAWTSYLQVRLGPGYAVENDGLAGTTLLKQGEHPYWGTPPFEASHAASPEIVVIILGTNDSNPFNWRGHKDEFVIDYETLIDSYASLPSHPKIFLALVPPAGANGYHISGANIEHGVNPKIRQIAAAKGLPVIDLFSAFGGRHVDPALYGSAEDHVHPSDEGARRIADTVYAAITGRHVEARRSPSRQRPAR